jgi:hypothetical protein
MPPLLNVGRDEIIPARRQDCFPQARAVSDATGAYSGRNPNVLETLDLVDVDDIERIQHTDVDRLPR